MRTRLICDAPRDESRRSSCSSWLPGCHGKFRVIRSRYVGGPSGGDRSLALAARMFSARFGRFGAARPFRRGPTLHYQLSPASSVRYLTRLRASSNEFAGWHSAGFNDETWDRWASTKIWASR